MFISWEQGLLSHKQDTDQNLDINIGTSLIFKF